MSNMSTNFMTGFKNMYINKPNHKTNQQPLTIKYLTI